MSLFSKKINKESISTENNIKSIKLTIKDEIKSAKEKFDSTKSRNYLKTLFRTNNGRGIRIENYIYDIKKIFNKYSSVTPCEEYKEKNMNSYKKCEDNKVKYYNMLKTLLEEILDSDFVKYIIDYERFGGNDYYTSFKNYINKQINKIKIKKDNHQKKLSDVESSVEKKNNKINLQSGGKKTTIKKNTIKKNTEKSVKNKKQNKK